MYPNSLLAAAQRGVLQDMGHTGVVWWVCLEADGEDIVAIVAGDVQVLGAGLVMLQMQRRQLELGDMLGPQQGEAVELVAGLGILRELGHSSASALGSIAKHGSRRRTQALTEGGPDVFGRQAGRQSVG